jgi:hypothetical protein
LTPGKDEGKTARIEKQKEENSLENTLVTCMLEASCNYRTRSVFMQRIGVGLDHVHVTLRAADSLSAYNSIRTEEEEGRGREGDGERKILHLKLQGVPCGRKYILQKCSHIQFLSIAPANTDSSHAHTHIRLINTMALSSSWYICIPTQVKANRREGREWVFHADSRTQSDAKPMCNRWSINY